MSMFDKMMDTLPADAEAALARVAALLREHERSAQTRARTAMLAGSAMGALPDKAPEDAVTALAYAIDTTLAGGPLDADDRALQPTVALLQQWAGTDEGGDEWGIEQEMRDYRSLIAFLGDHI